MWWVGRGVRDLASGNELAKADCAATETRSDVHLCLWC